MEVTADDYRLKPQIAATTARVVVSAHTSFHAWMSSRWTVGQVRHARCAWGGGTDNHLLTPYHAPSPTTITVISQPIPRPCLDLLSTVTVQHRHSTCGWVS